jgi:multidrug efflux pump
LLAQFPGIEEVDFREVAQLDEYTVKINRERAAQLDVSMDDIAWTLRTLVKGERAGTFEKDGRMYPVRFELANQYRSKPEELSAIFLKGRGEDNRYESMIPLGELCSYSIEKGDTNIRHKNKNRSYDVDARVKPGYNAVERYEAFLRFLEAKKILTNEYSIEPTGEIENYYKEQGTIYVIFGLAMAFIFLVMAAQFESLRDPLIILISVPLAVGGALVSLFLLRNGSINVYSQIGCITLVGLITKHGILLVDFANQLKIQGKSTLQAILQSCQMRLRPILMTTFAMVLGAVPLAMGGGAGSEARNQIGIVIVGGMTIGTIFTLFVIPAVYILLSKDRTNASLPPA